MKLPRSMKKRIRDEQEKMLIAMSRADIETKDWDILNKKYQVYTEMLKPSWKVTPDTLLIVGGNLIGILAILNFERFDIVRSKALSFVLKGRV